MAGQLFFSGAMALLSGIQLSHCENPGVPRIGLKVSLEAASTTSRARQMSTTRALQNSFIRALGSSATHRWHSRLRLSGSLTEYELAPMGPRMKNIPRIFMAIFPSVQSYVSRQAENEPAGTTPLQLGQKYIL